MSEHTKKKIAPIVVTVLIILYYVLYFALLMTLMPLPLKVLLGFIPAAVGFGMVYVCIQRIKEIDGGEEDDLSQY